MRAIIDAIKTKTDLDMAGVRVEYNGPIDEQHRSRLETAKVYVDGVYTLCYVYSMYRVDKTIHAIESTFVDDIVKACKVSLEWKARIDAKYCDICEVPLRHHTLGLSYTASGYGNKLPTRYKVHYEGKWRRVYSVCYSNVSSEYIMFNGKHVTVFL